LVFKLERWLVMTFVVRLDFEEKNGLFFK